MLTTWPKGIYVDNLVCIPSLLLREPRRVLNLACDPGTERSYLNNRPEPRVCRSILLSDAEFTAGVSSKIKDPRWKDTDVK